MAYTTIDDPSVHFQTKLFTGNGSSRSITNDGNSDLQPDFVWVTSRSNGYNRGMFDSTRGPTKEINSNQATTEATLSGGLSAFDSDGFSFQGASYNTNAYTFVAWQWKANAGSRTTFNESGDNPGGGYQANTTAGFSVVDYVGTGDNGATVSHGLGAVPHWIMFKNRDTAQTWVVYHHLNTSAPETDILQLEATNATYDSNTYFNDTAPTSSVFSLGTSNDLNKDDDEIIAYVWTGIKGFSKFGGYRGNGSTDGTFVFTGFKPAWIMIKNTAASANWHMYDNQRDVRNVAETALQANTNAQEFTTNNKIDFLSNGFKIRAGDEVSTNTSGSNYVYMAFAEHPYVSSKGVPVHAR